MAGGPWWQREADCPAAVQVLAQSHLNWSNRLICCGRAGSSCHAENPGRYSIVGFFDLLRLSLMTHLALNPNGSISISLFFVARSAINFTISYFKQYSMYHLLYTRQYQGPIWVGFDLVLTKVSVLALLCCGVPLCPICGNLMEGGIQILRRGRAESEKRVPSGQRHAWLTELQLAEWRARARPEAPP